MLGDDCAFSLFVVEIRHAKKEAIAGTKAKGNEHVVHANGSNMAIDPRGISNL